MNTNKYHEDANAQETINALIAGVNEWKGTFETPPVIDFRFEVTPSGILTLNGIALCPVSDVAAKNPICFDVEDLTIVTKSGKHINIDIVWPCGDDKAVISCIIESRLLYAIPAYL